MTYAPSIPHRLLMVVETAVDAANTAPGIINTSRTLVARMMSDRFLNKKCSMRTPFSLMWLSKNLTNLL
jgi:hypothetical protein